MNGLCMVLYHALDLVWATRIKATADAAGVPARPVRSLEMLEARLGDSPVNGVILDLESPEISLAILDRLRGSDDSRLKALPVIAYGPHVAVELLEQAAAKGATRVMARGAFSSRLEEILRTLDRGSEA